MTKDVNSKKDSGDKIIEKIKDSVTGKSQEEKGSLKGVSGCLMAFVIAMLLGGITNIGLFFTTIAAIVTVGPTVSGIMMMLFSLAIATMLILTALFIIKGKKLGRIMALITIGVMSVHAVLQTVVGIVSSCMPSHSSYEPYYYIYSNYLCSSGAIIMMVGGLFVGLAVYALAAYYFISSERVKNTLVK